MSSLFFINLLIWLSDIRSMRKVVVIKDMIFKKEKLIGNINNVFNALIKLWKISIWVEDIWPCCMKEKKDSPATLKVELPLDMCKCNNQSSSNAIAIIDGER